ncbi:biotin/lipoyl-containing protein, partial [Kaarinaea lacus]
MEKEILVPDIGDFENVEVVELLVKSGDAINVEDSLISVESDKATMEIPAPEAGVVKELKVNLGDKVSQGSLILLLEPASNDPAAAPAEEAAAPGAEEPAVKAETET